MPLLFDGYTFYTLKQWYAPYKYISCQALVTSQGATWQFVDTLPDTPLLAIDLIIIPDPLQASDPSLPKSLNRGANEDVHSQYLVSMVSVSWLEECVAKQEVLPNDQGNPSGITEPNGQIIPYSLHASYLELCDAMRTHDWSPKNHCQRFFAQWYEDHPEDSTPWPKLYMKVLENACPAFAANSLVTRRFHRPKAKSTPPFLSWSGKEASKNETYAETSTPPMYLFSSNPPNPMPATRYYPANHAWLKARNWSVDDQGSWSNPDPVFQCGSCRPVHARGLCAFASIQQITDANGGGIRTGKCISCHVQSRARCTMASRMQSQRYHWVQGGSGSKWETTGRTDGRRPGFCRVPLVNHATRSGRRGHTRGTEVNTTVFQPNELDTAMIRDVPVRSPTPTSVTSLTHGQQVMDEEQASEDEEEMTYVGWEQVRSGNTISKQVPETELEAPGPSREFSDQSRYDDYADHMPSLEDNISEDADEAAEGSMAVAEQTECKLESGSPEPYHHLDHESDSWSGEPDTRSTTGESSLPLPQIDWIHVNPDILNGPHDTLLTSAMEQLLLLAAFSPPNEQYQHILPTTFWPKLLHLCAQGEKFSQIMKFVGVSYKADLFDEDFAIPILQDGYWSLVIVDHQRERITAVVSGEEIIGLEEQVKVIRIAAHATQDIKENQIPRLQAVPRANKTVYDRPYKLCLRIIPNNVPSAATGHVMLAFACQYNGPEAVRKMLRASLKDPQRLADRAYLQGVLEVFGQDS